MRDKFKLLRVEQRASGAEAGEVPGGRKPWDLHNSSVQHKCSKSRGVPLTGVRP